MPQLKRAILVSLGISVTFRVFKTQLRESLLSERVMATLSGFFGSSPQSSPRSGSTA
jgi:hypothetical protein